VAHLAGAMGKPVWILLPYAPDWRWLLGRDDSPWYPTARLFRQARAGDWGDAADAVSKALRSADIVRSSGFSRARREATAQFAHTDDDAGEPRRPRLIAI
jgi:hypothetical protein